MSLPLFLRINSPIKEELLSRGAPHFSLALKLHSAKLLLV